MTSATARAVTVVTPVKIEPGAGYSVTVLGQPGEAGLFVLSSGDRPVAEFNFTTDMVGTWTYRDVAPSQSGTLNLLVILNRSGSWSGSITVAAPSCTSENAENCLSFLRYDLLGMAAQLGFLIAILIVLLNLPAIATSLARYRREAQLTGAPSLKELAKLPITAGWTLPVPTRQIVSTLPSERVAIEIMRREAVAELMQIARRARRFDYDSHAALVMATRKIVSLYILERGVLKRPSKEVT